LVQAIIADRVVNVNPPRDASLPPGYDEENPYDDVDLSTFPEWWRRNVEEFESYSMRPYRPPRFADGTLAPKQIESLKEELGVHVQFRAKNPQSGGQWYIVVDGEPVEQIEHVRHGEGYTVYDLTADRFETLVRDAVQG
jgi:hypothetical protein